MAALPTCSPDMLLKRTWKRASTKIPASGRPGSVATAFRYSTLDGSLDDSSPHSAITTANLSARLVCALPSSGDRATCAARSYRKRRDSVSNATASSAPTKPHRNTHAPTPDAPR
eukprot:366039-Chlamydomonas_euryale.AAC.21